jgi:DNA-binding NtrC family response regulator
MLGELGCETARAANASEGLELFEKGDFEGVISDMVMPGEQSGLDLVRDIRERRPDLPLLLMTGYSSAASEARQDGFVLLEKPFNMDRLAQALGQVFGFGKAQ